MEKRLINVFSLILIFLISWSQLHGQRSGFSKKGKSNIEKFALVPFTQAVHSDSVNVTTFIEIPFYTVQFVKDGNDFVAAYQASIGLKIKKEENIDHQVWIDSIWVDSYEETKSRVKNRKHFFSMTLSKNETYEVVGELQDLDTRKKGIITKNLDLRDYRKTLSVVTPIFLLDFEGDWGFGPGKIPTRGHRVREIGEGISIQISGFVGLDPYSIEIMLNNSIAQDSIISVLDYTGKSTGYFNEIIFISADLLKSLKNDFTIYVRQKKKTDKKVISFTMYKPGISNFIYDISAALKQMKYILTNEENLKLKGTSKKEKENLFYAFWQNRDPTPKTEFNELMEEYYGRVWYTNEHFEGWQPGWETDRGMIYILFGPPDSIEKTNTTTSMTSSYQIWHYYQANKNFVFRDQNGFGDYRLETPFRGQGL